MWQDNQFHKSHSGYALRISSLYTRDAKDNVNVFFTAIKSPTRANNAHLAIYASYSMKVIKILTTELTGPPAVHLGPCFLAGRCV